MAYVHELNDWPNMNWSMASLAEQVASVRHKQGHLLGRMEGFGFELRSEANLAALTEEVVRSSAIEGEHLPSDEVRSSIARRLGLDAGGLPKPSRAVEGIVEMMIDATRNYSRPLSVERLFAWHAALFPTGRSGMHSIQVGAWRTADAGPMRVVSGAVGKERIHFEAPHADRLEMEMRHFLDWFNGTESLDPILKAAVAHFWFVTIHPFEDGNGRVARAIADLALARSDGTADRFYSMSSRIEAERKDYYLTLEAAQRGSTDITVWMAWFLGCLERAIDGSNALLANVLRKARMWQLAARYPVNDRQRLVINRLLDSWQGNLTSSKYAALTKCSVDTAQRDIHELVERGVLAQNKAGGRSTSYRMTDVG
jgi:Fic family protein